MLLFLGSVASVVNQRDRGVGYVSQNVYCMGRLM